MNRGTQKRHSAVLSVHRDGIPYPPLGAVMSFDGFEHEQCLLYDILKGLLCSASTSSEHKH